MAAKRFEDMIVWQKAQNLSVGVYKMLGHCRDYNFRDQAQRAAVSIMNNLAEGFERGSKKEFRYFCGVAKGSCGEVRSMLYLSLSLRYISQQEFDLLYAQATEVSRMIAGLTKTL